jgi:hypothetical protein
VLPRRSDVRRYAARHREAIGSGGGLSAQVDRSRRAESREPRNSTQDHDRPAARHDGIGQNHSRVSSRRDDWRRRLRVRSGDADGRHSANPDHRLRAKRHSRVCQSHHRANGESRGGAVRNYLPVLPQLPGNGSSRPARVLQRSAAPARRASDVAGLRRRDWSMRYPNSSSSIRPARKIMSMRKPCT